MSRTRAVETRIEEQLPAIEEFITSGFLTKAEGIEVNRSRTLWEYKLVAKPLLMLDVQNAVKYELSLEERLRRYCQQTKVNLKHRWSVLERIEYIYGIGMKHLKNKQEKETNRRDNILFLKSANRIGSLSKLYAQLMIAFPTRSDVWVEAALWEGAERRNTDHGRAIAQQALVTMAGEPAVWAAALRLELEFAGRLMGGLVEEHTAQAMKKREAAKIASAAAAATDDDDGDEEGTKKTKSSKKKNKKSKKVDHAEENEEEVKLSDLLRTENAAMAELLLGLELAKAVVEEAVDSAAAGPELLRQLLAVCGGYGFAREVAAAAVDATTRRMYAVLAGTASAASGHATRHLVASVIVAGGRKRSAEDMASSSSSGAVVPTATTTSQAERARWADGGLAYVLRANLTLDTLCLDGFQTPMRDATSYLDAMAAAGSRRDLIAAVTGAASAADRTRAAAASLATVLSLAAMPAAVRREIGCCNGNGNSGRRQQRRQLLAVWDWVIVVSAVQLLATLAATASREAVSRACVALLTAGRSSNDNSTNAVVAPFSAKGKGKGRTAAAPPTNQQQQQQQQSSTTAAVRAIIESIVLDTGATTTTTATATAAVVSKADREDVEAEFMRPAAERVAALADLAAAAAVGSNARRARVEQEEDKDDSGDDAEEGTRWPASQLGRFLTEEDRKALASFNADVGGCGASAARRHVTSDDVDELLLWWRAEERGLSTATRTANGYLKTKNDDEDAIRARLRDGAVAFFRRFGLIPPSSSAAVPSSEALHHQQQQCHPLLLVSSIVSYTDAAATPLCVWRVFNALEVTEGAAVFAASAASSSSSNNDSSDSDGDDDRDDDDKINGKGKGRQQQKQKCFDSYAAAGAHFLATAPHGGLDRQGQLDRCVGLTALARSRLFSLTGVRATAGGGTPQTTRAELIDSLAPKTTIKNINSNISDASAAARIAAMGSFVDGLQSRCQPLPRQCLVTVVIPFLEAAAVVAGGGGATSKSNALTITTTTIATSAAVQRARAAHERLLNLYTLTRHLSDFIPILFHPRHLANRQQQQQQQQQQQDSGVDGVAAALSPRHTDLSASLPLVEASNVEDWLSFIRFERVIARDLDAARAVTERARRSCLGPQMLLVKLSTSG